MLGGLVQDERWLLKQAVTEAATNDLFRIAHFLVKYYRSHYLFYCLFVHNLGKL